MKIKATILAILFPKNLDDVNPAAQNFYVLLTTLGKAVGATRALPRLHHAYLFTGNYEVYQGQQNFRFTTLEEDIPQDPKALLDYACLVTKGLGPAFANATWEKHGRNFRAALETEVKTAREKQLLATLRTLDESASRTKAISTLIAQGFTQHLAELAWQHFGESTLSIVHSNPYELANLPGQSFATVDSRLREPPFSIPQDDENRLRAYLAYTLSTLAETEGHTLACTSARNLLSAILPNPPDAIDRLSSVAQTLSTPRGEALCLKKYLAIEQAIHAYLLNPHDLLPGTPREETLDALGDPVQQQAARAVIASTGLHLVNGSAGTGKTTLIKTIATLLQDAGRNFAIASFAGKAAARIREATGFPASTIHSLLKFIPEKGFTEKDLSAKTVIVDEASMVPSTLLHAIIAAKPASIILVGDEAQLPPVGPGSPFHDIVRLGDKTHIHTLSTCYRNKAAINQAANAVRNGQMPHDHLSSDGETFNVLHVSSPEAAQQYVETLIARNQLDFFRDIIITPRNGTDEPNAHATAAALNTLIADKLGLPYPSVSSRLICLKNTPDLDVWNGTTATIDAIDIDGNAYVTTDEGNQVRLPEQYLQSSTAPAYALTIHKAQGSQYRRVAILVLQRDLHALLSRQMLYTAITRARQGCLILTDLPSLYPVIQKQTRRETILAELIEQNA